MSLDLTSLQTLLDSDCLLTDGDSLQHYGKDWTNFYTVAPIAIAFPKTTEQVQAVVRWCAQNQVAIVPSGGRTGLSGGAVASNGELVVALDKMNNILDFNAAAKRLHCQAGVITEQIQQFADDNSLYYPVDFASTGSSQIGGNIATNAGGIKVIKYGMTRDWVLGLTVVTGSGEILELNQGLVKNATGYDFRHLFIGSEGTLGIITETTIGLCRKPQNLTVLLLAIPDLNSLMPILEAFQQQIDLTAYEFFSDVALSKVMDIHKMAAPLKTEAPFYCLLELDASSETELDKAFAVFETCMEQGLLLDGAISQSEQQAQDLWKYREYISESISHYKPYKNDIAVTPEKISKFLEEVDVIVKSEYPEFEVVWFGHIGDGNLHLNILKPEALSVDDFKSQCDKVSPKIFQRLQEMKGTISAEHGVGLLKKPYLNYSRTDAEIQLMKAVKKVFDPNNIMNPGKLI
ncbi:FAD-binding oxidoreductase [Kangiella sp. HZ709]|uniref:FAD-binding oxidoreductase n=1 Tax=Kangiella sp. HZ709 TaxID=2666328 RepID=UPI0012AFDAB5|nr:FAD-binding oxidoreductase [Kangiella sp. HZ709]MRX26757.1 FAD-binding protein [Kangiella sp. HZ709]